MRYCLHRIHMARPLESPSDYTKTLALFQQVTRDASEHRIACTLGFVYT